MSHRRTVTRRGSKVSESELFQEQVDVCRKCFRLTTRYVPERRKRFGLCHECGYERWRQELRGVARMVH